MNATLSERIKKLPPEKLDQLLKQFKPGAKLKSPVMPPKPAKRPFREAQDENFYLTVETPGVLDSLRFTTRKREPLNPDQIEVEVHAACVNFRDVAVALGIYPMPPCGTMPEFGCDGAGRVVKVGSAVTKFKPGDDIFFLASDSTFSRYARTREMASFPKPPHWSYEEAAGLALVYITVAYALRVPGRLARGERIVVHSAAGGIGLAAIQMARKIGAEIYATAGTDEKREYLRSIGIEHIMDSRSLSFVEEITAATNGEGVDVILNSLAGEAIDAGIKLLRPDGRFLELGKRDLAPGRMLDLGRFTLTLLFAAVDTSYLFHLFPERLDPIVAELRADFASGALQPLPTRTFRSSEVLDAFRYMTTGKHIGRIVVSMKGEPVMVTAS